MSNFPNGSGVPGSFGVKNVELGCTVGASVMRVKVA
jgi:hypothetical protein